MALESVGNQSKASPTTASTVLLLEMAAPQEAAAASLAALSSMHKSYSRAPACFDIFYSLISCTVIFKIQTQKIRAIIPITGDAVFIREEARRTKETKKEKR